MTIINRPNEAIESAKAQISLAGIRIVLTDTVAPGASAAATYTVASAATKRVMLIYPAGTIGDITVDPNATADANSLPVVPDMYFVLEAYKGEEISVFNTTGSGITVHCVELY